MSTVTETTIDAIDALREAGGRLANELPSSIPSTLAHLPSEWPDIAWPGDVVDRVVGDGRSSARRPLLIGGIAIASLIAVVWFVRRRRSTPDVEERIRHAAQTTNAA